MTWILFPLLGIIIVFLIVFLATLIRSVRVVPTKTVLVVERLGKYHRSLMAGFHVLIPFIDRVRYTHTIKEQAIDVPEQDCFTKDNVKVQIDGVLYLRVDDPKKASYGISDYRYATILLAQTTMRSVVGRLDLDETFEARERMNAQVVKVLDEASDPWGVKVTRYEIQNIRVSDSIMQAMENQMKAEREKRAVIARSVGEREMMVNLSRASYQEAINISEGEKERMIREAEGQAAEIISVAQATAQGIRQIAQATRIQGGVAAAKLSVTNAWLDSLSNVQAQSKIILSTDLTDVKDITSTMANALFTEENIS